jgi:hypothetical protein
LLVSRKTINRYIGWAELGFGEERRGQKRPKPWGEREGKAFPLFIKSFLFYF